MKIFVTGASGYIGSAVAEQFRNNGHWVVGLIRSDAKKRALEQREIRTLTGDMRHPESYAPLAKEADVWVHCAAEYSADWESLDRQTVNTFLEWSGANDRRRIFVYTSGVWLYGSTVQMVNESVAIQPAKFLEWRGEHEKKVLAAAGPSLRTLVIRPGVVYGGRGGFTGAWFESARKRGAATVIGDGKNRWAMIHVQDLARLYVQAVEKRLSGEIFNATDRSRFTVLEMAEAASRAAESGGRISHIPLEEAERSYGASAAGFLLDQNVDSTKAVQMLDWHPRFGGFAENATRYFLAWRAYQSEAAAAITSR